MSLQPPAVSPHPGQLFFGRFCLDLGSGKLLSGHRDIVVRAKTHAVLLHLLVNAGRLVTKDELFAAVWPKLAVTDDVLVQSISELREALAPDGEVIIKTLPRRGYRIDVPVRSAQPEAAVHATSPADPRATAVAPSMSLPGDLARIGQAAARGKTSHRANGRAWLVIASAVGLSMGIWSLGSAPWGLFQDGRSAAAVDLRAGRPSVAILPFLGSDGPGVDHYVDGITQDIIAALGRFPALTVMSWNAVRLQRNELAQPRTIARALGVLYQVEGRIHRANDRLLVTAQLVDGAGQVLWSGRFDHAASDVFSLQEKITEEIAGTLAARVAQVEQRRAFDQPTRNLAAYDLMLRARPLLQAPSRADHARARELLRQALDLDPRYAEAHAAFAESFYTDLSMGWAQTPSATLSRAEAHANTALNLDRDQVRARVVLGRIHILQRRYDQARSEFTLATRSNPSDAQALGGLGHLLTWFGEADAAIEMLEKALRLDPQLNAIDRFSLALAYYSKRRYADAIAQAERNLQLARDTHFNRIILAAAYAQRGWTAEVNRFAAELKQVNAALVLNDFGTKFSNPADLEHLRDGLRKAGLVPG